jgi:hypothetical protein
METRSQREHVAEEVAHLALAVPSEGYELVVAEIRRYAARLLDGGHPREELLGEFERARQLLDHHGAPEDAQDPILDVMDYLVGWCAEGARL